MSYKFSIIQNYDSNEHVHYFSDNVPGFFSIKKILYESYNSNETIEEFIDQYNQIVIYRDIHYRTLDPTVNIPYLAFIHLYQYQGRDFLRDKTYLIVNIQRKFREYQLKKLRLMKSPAALRYRSIHGKFPSYSLFYSSKFKIYC